MIVAAVAEANDCIVVTDNEKDFDGLEIIESIAESDLRTAREARRVLYAGSPNDRVSA